MPTADPGPRATRAGVSRDTARNQILLDHQDALAATALRTRSIHAREVLVEAAWPGAGPEHVERWADSVVRAGGGDPPAGADVYHLGQYARVLALQRVDDAEDRRRARTLLEALALIEAGAALGRLHPQAVLVLLHLRCLDGDAQGAAALLEHPQVPTDVADAVRADLANPFLADGDPHQEDVDGWLASLTRALLPSRRAQLRLTPADGSTPLDRLTTPPVEPADRDGDPLVSVAVSCYRPGQALLTAVRSLTAQSWRALEILLVDDASGPEAQPWLSAAEALDPRVRVIRKQVNGGTYRARNTALRQARGAYATTLDSDDWLHPEAVAVLVRALQADPVRMAVQALGARVSPDLRLVRLGYRHRAVAAPTLLVRLDPVLSRLGLFDPARKAADTEFSRRIQAAFGDAAVHTVDECLLLLRAGETLSSSEFGRMWRHGARHAYKCLYTPWHEEIRAGAAAYLDPVRDRPVPEPRRWSRPRDPAFPAPRRLDLVLAGDWRRYGGPQRSMLEEARAARGAGLRVGIMHLEALRFGTTRDLPLCAPVTELLRRRELEWVQPDDDVDVDVLLVRYPLVLQHPPLVPGALRPEHLLVVANQAPVEPDGTDQRYVVGDVTHRARELFGTDPVWVPQGPVVREVLREQDPDIALTPWDSPGLIDLAQWRVRPTRAPGAAGPVVVGRYSRDHPLKFPATHADLVRAYSFGPGYEVRMMGALATWRALADQAGLGPEHPVPDSWRMLRHQQVDPRELLAGLDFVVYQDHPGRHEAFGRVLLESAASGALVIAHPKHRPVFGEVLDYATPEGVRDLVEAYVADPRRYAQRVEQVQRLVAERYSHASFVRRLARVSGSVAARVSAAGGGEVGREVEHEVAGRSGREDGAGGQQADRGDGAAEHEVAWAGSVRLVVDGCLAGEDHRDAATVRVEPGAGLVAHETRVRSAADAGRADRVVLVLPEPLPGRARELLREAWAVPEEAALDPALLTAAAAGGLPAVLLRRDGMTQLLAAPGVEVDPGAPGDPARPGTAILTPDLTPAGWTSRCWRGPREVEISLRRAAGAAGR